MFGVIVAGRLIQTNFQQVGDGQFLFNIPEADSINHIVIFMTGTTPFPENIGGLVYFSWPDPDAPPSWLLLGYISNEKPSAIFKVSKLKSMPASAHPFGIQQISQVAQIGIAFDQLSNIALQTPTQTATPSTIDMFTEYTNKMLENFYNYSASFAKSFPGMSENFVPVSCLHRWYETFQRRLEQNPYFWRN